MKPGDARLSGSCTPDRGNISSLKRHSPIMRTKDKRAFADKNSGNSDILTAARYMTIVLRSVRQHGLIKSIIGSCYIQYTFSF